MHADFWHERWQKREIAFHESAVNPMLSNNFHRLALEPGARVFVPLCGKTLDIAWLLAQRCQVVGAELSELAVRELFEELGVTPTISSSASLKRYATDALEIFVGDIFDLTAQLLGPINATYDRAALVALPTDMRTRYAAHLVALTARAPVLQITFDYDQTQMQGPPFSVPEAELERLYAADYQRQSLQYLPVAGGLKGSTPANEGAWLLTPLR